MLAASCSDFHVIKQLIGIRLTKLFSYFREEWKEIRKLIKGRLHFVVELTAGTTKPIDKQALKVI